LLLHHLPQLLELGVVAEPLQIPKTLLLRGGLSCRSRAGAGTASTASARTATLLGGKIEKIDRAVIVTTSSWSREGGSCRGGLTSRTGLRLLLLQVFRNALDVPVSLSIF
jgi:hypothetical protein